MQPGEEWEESGKDAGQPPDLLPGGIQPGEEWEETGEDAGQPPDLLPGGMQPSEEWEEAGKDAGQPPDLLYLVVCSLVRSGKRREKILVSLLISYTWRYAAW